jgi:hypothetical protein
MAFFNPPATAFIGGIGSSNTNFALTNGELDKALMGAAYYCGYPDESFPFYRWRIYDGRGDAYGSSSYRLNQFYMNLTASFSLKFEVTLQEERSWKFKNESDSNTPA